MQKLKETLQDAGVVVKDRKKVLKNNSPVVQMWQLRLAEQQLPAIKMGDQAMKKVKKADEPSVRSWICCEQSMSYGILEEYARALQKAEQAVDEDPKLASALSTLGAAQIVSSRWDEGSAIFEKAIAIGPAPVARGGSARHQGRAGRGGEARGPARGQRRGGG